MLVTIPVELLLPLAQHESTDSCRWLGQEQCLPSGGCRALVCLLQGLPLSLVRNEVGILSNLRVEDD